MSTSISDMRSRAVKLALSARADTIAAKVPSAGINTRQKIMPGGSSVADRVLATVQRARGVEYVLRNGREVTLPPHVPAPAGARRKSDLTDQELRGLGIVPVDGGQDIQQQVPQQQSLVPVDAGQAADAPVAELELFLHDNGWLVNRYALFPDGTLAPLGTWAPADASKAPGGGNTMGAALLGLATGVAGTVAVNSLRKK